MLSLGAALFGSLCGTLLGSLGAALLDALSDALPESVGNMLALAMVLDSLGTELTCSLGGALRATGVEGRTPNAASVCGSRRPLTLSLCDF